MITCVFFLLNFSENCENCEKAKIAEHRKLVDQLKKEESITRINVSQAAADLIKVINRS